VAGHTHGGQVALPFYGAIAIPTAAPREWAHGWVHHGGNSAYVTSGLGVSILPLRFGMRPEWALITLRRK
jgi:predicted MPP superfamily phosphohydrolase